MSRLDRTAWAGLISDIDPRIRFTIHAHHARAATDQRLTVTKEALCIGDCPDVAATGTFDRGGR